MLWAAMLIHGDNLCFSGYSIKEFFDVIAEDCTDVMRKLLGVLQEHNVVQGEVIDGFSFAIGSDIGWKSICRL